MPRMFDILRGKVKPPSAESGGSSKKEDTNLSISSLKRIFHAFGNQEKQDKMDALQMSKKLVDTIKKKDIDNEDIAKEKCNYALGLIESLFDKIAKQEPIESCIDEIYKVIDSLINQLILGNSLLEYTSVEYSADNYLPRHSINVCILSFAIGLQMKLNKSKLHSLGLVAMLHDIGLGSFKEIIEQPRKLSDIEITQVRTHVSKGAQIISSMRSPCYSSLKKIIEQHHERVNAKGYPFGLKGNEIHEYAKIVGLADTYEAMTHPRCFHTARIPHQAIREITGPFKSFFEPDIIKAFVGKLSIYPIGSFVRLNSEEIAKVISSNLTSPLRPIVLVLLDSNGKHISEPKTINLSESNAIYIKEPVLLNESQEG